MNASTERGSHAVEGEPTRVTRLLDWNDATLVESLETEGYLYFDGGRSSPLLRGLWIWDDAAQRVRTRVPREDQRVWIEVDGERVHTAIVVNVRLALLQSAAYGFAVPPALADGRPLCEFTMAYSRDDHSIGHFHAAWDEAFRDLRMAGYGDGLATCARRLLPLYRRMGARIVEEAEISGERRYFLHFELERTSRWNSRQIERPDGEQRGLAAAHEDLGSLLAFAQEEIGIALARVLVATEIARGRPDPAVGLEARRRGARHVLAIARRALALAASSHPGDPALDHARRDADDAEALWDAVAAFASLAEGPGRTDETSPVSIVTESLDLILLTLIDAWDGDRNALDILRTMTAEDDDRALDRMSEALRERGEEEAASHVERVAEPFASAVGAIARIAARRGGFAEAESRNEHA